MLHEGDRRYNVCKTILCYNMFIYTILLLAFSLLQDSKSAELWFSRYLKHFN